MFEETRGEAVRLNESRSEECWRRLALAAFLGLAALHGVQDVARFPKLWVILPGCAALGALLVFAPRSDPERWRRWGLRSDNLPQAATCVGAPTAVLAACIVAWAVGKGYRIRFGSIALLLVLYPAWALVQQFSFQVLLRGALERLRLSPLIECLLLGIGFSLVHAPDVPLMRLTLIAGAAWALAYRWVPNLYAIALSHALLGSLVYICVLDRDPLDALAS